MKRALSRRTMLRGTAFGGAVGLALPTLEAMLDSHGTAHADGTPLPKRFVVWWFGNGVKPAQFFPTRTGPDWEVTAELAPLASLRSDFTLVSGTRCRADGFVHHSGQAGMLSGDTCNGPASDDSSTFRKATIDVILSRQWTGLSRFNLMNLSVFQNGNTGRGLPVQISYNGTSFNPNDNDPGKIYDRLFGTPLPTPAPGPAQVTEAQRAAARAKALDAVRADLSGLRMRVGTADRARLDQHAEGLLAVQRRIAALAVDGGGGGGAASGCAQPAVPTVTTRDTLAARNRVLSELMAMGFACDLFRVATYQHHTWYSPTFAEIGQTQQQHQLTHDEPGAQPKVHDSVVFVMGQLATTIKTLKAISEGAGTLLDSSLVYATSEVSEGVSHSKDNMPIILAGGAGGALRRGLHVRTSGASAYRVVLSMFRALGVNIPTWGTGDLTESTPLAELLV